jgi:protein involved in temperature-dependent protein secretion
MDAVMAAFARGDYPQAYDLLQQTPDAATQNGKAMGAVLLALIERFDEADRMLEAADVPAFQVILRGERQRTTRWRDPEANGSLTATDDVPLIPIYVAIATAFVRENQTLADQAKAKLTELAQPLAGKLTFIDGEVLAFTDITDGDDSIGQMLETYCGEGLLYFPFATLQRIEVLPRVHFLDHLMPRVRITDAHGTSQAYVPLLYACSATSPITQVRTGEATLTMNLGTARRGHGQRGLIIDGAKLAGFHRVAAIDFDPHAQTPTTRSTQPLGQAPTE